MTTLCFIRSVTVLPLFLDARPEYVSGLQVNEDYRRLMVSSGLIVPVFLRGAIQWTSHAKVETGADTVRNKKQRSPHLAAQDGGFSVS